MVDVKTLSGFWSFHECMSMDRIRGVWVSISLAYWTHWTGMCNRWCDYWAGGWLLTPSGDHLFSAVVYDLAELQLYA